MPFDLDSVRWIRHVQKLQSLKQRLLAAGWVTAKQLGVTFGVGRTTLRRWHAGTPKAAFELASATAMASGSTGHRQPPPRLPIRKIGAKTTNEAAPLRKVQYENHSFLADVEHGIRCGGSMRWVEAATSAEAIARLLAKHGLAPRPPPPSRSAPIAPGWLHCRGFR